MYALSSQPALFVTVIPELVVVSEDDELPLLDDPLLDDPELLEPDDEELPDEEDPLDELDDVNVYFTYGTNIFELE